VNEITDILSKNIFMSDVMSIPGMQCGRYLHWRGRKFSESDRSNSTINPLLIKTSTAVTRRKQHATSVFGE